MVSWLKGPYFRILKKLRDHIKVQSFAGLCQRSAGTTELAGT